MLIACVHAEHERECARLRSLIENERVLRMEKEDVRRIEQ